MQENKKKCLTRDTQDDYNNYVPIKCTCGRTVGLRKNALIVGSIYVKCRYCKKWVVQSDILEAQ